MSQRSRYGSKGERNRALKGRRLCMETLEPRLALTWAGVPPISLTPFNALPVTLNTNNIASGTTTIATTEVDFYSFTARTNGAHEFSATTPSSNVDTVIGLFSASGQRLAYNDNISSTNTDSRFTTSLTAGTQYYLGVTNRITTSRGTYTWIIDGPSASTATDDNFEENDSLTSAFNLGSLNTSTSFSQLKLVDSADWYRFTTTATGKSTNSVSISFQNLQGNLQLGLYSSTGSLLATSTTTGNAESISLSGRSAGTYYLRVYGNAGATNPNYTLSIAPPAGGGTASAFQIDLTMTGLSVTQQAVFAQAAARWSQVIVGDLPNATYQGQFVDDVLIDASAVPIDGVNGILGQAAPDAFRGGTFLPYHGFMQFDTADLASLEQNGTLLAVILHEMGHVLGVGTIWEIKGLLTGAGTADPLFIGTQATAAYNQIFGLTATGVPVENSGGGGTRDSHWRETIFQTELMTGYLGPGVVNPLSRITVGSLGDLGYTVNLAMADTYTKPLASAGSAAKFAAMSGRLTLLQSSVDTAQVDWRSNSRVPLSTNTAASTQRRQLIEIDSTRFTREVVDAVMTAAFQRTDNKPTHDVLLSDESDSLEDADFNLALEQFDYAWKLSI
jgi:hypothetical protein